MKVTGNIIFCLKSGIVIGSREKYASKQYAVEVVRGSKAHFHLEVTDKQGHPVQLAVDVQREIIEACTVLTETDNSEEMAVLWANRPDQARLQEVWNKYDLWPYFIFISNRPKPKKPKPKKPTELYRVGSVLANAILNAWTATKNEEGMIVAGAPLPIKAKRTLLKLAQYIPKDLQTNQPNLFGEWAPSAMTISQRSIKDMANDLFGDTKPEAMRRVIINLQAAAATSLTLARNVEKPSERGAPRRGALQFYTGPFITIHGEIPYTKMPDGTKIFDITDGINISLNNVFGYWVRRYYSMADIPAILKRSRGKGGMEYLAIRLWGIDIAPQVAAATRTEPFEATFALSNLMGGALTENPDGTPTERTEGKYAAEERRERLMGIVAEAATDMGATYIGPTFAKRQGGQKIVGVRFRWEKSIQAIEAKEGAGKT